MQIVIEVRDDEYRASKTISEIDGDRGYIRFPAERIANGIILPEHYGRLIDAEKLKHDWVDVFDTRYGDDVSDLFKVSIDKAPTIIPATKEEQRNCENCAKAWTDDCEEALCFGNNFCEWKPATKEGE